MPKQSKDAASKQRGAQKQNGLEEKVLKELKRVTGLLNIQLDQSMQELGVDSIGALELVMSLEREFDIHVPDESIEQLKTPRQVIELVKALSVIHVP